MNKVQLGQGSISLGYALYQVRSLCLAAIQQLVLASQIAVASGLRSLWRETSHFLEAAGCDCLLRPPKLEPHTLT